MEEYDHKLGVLEDYCDWIGRSFQEIEKSYYFHCVGAYLSDDDLIKAMRRAYEKEGKLIYKKSGASASFEEWFKVTRSRSFVGTPEECVKLKHFIDMGATYFILKFIDFPEKKESVRFFNEKSDRQAIENASSNKLEHFCFFSSTFYRYRLFYICNEYQNSEIIHKRGKHKMELIDILMLLIGQVLTVPAVLMGLIALVGLALERKSLSEVFVGTLKTMFGIIILNLGCGAIVNATYPLSSVMNAAFKVQGIIPDGTLGLIYGMFTPINWPMTFSLVLALGFVLMLVIARFTPFKCVHLTGHILVGWAFNFTLIAFAFGLRDIPLIIVGSIMAALYWTVMPWIVHRWDKDWIPEAGFTLGHDEYLAIIFGCSVGSHLGDPKKESCEKLKLPGWLSVLQDNTISSTIVMLVLWLSMVLIAGESAVSAYTGGQYWLIWAVIQAITFTSGIMVVLFGVRIFVGQIMPAFTGISRRVVPGAIPALDCPTVYPFGPQAVLVGYVAYLVGEISATLTQLAIGYPYVSFPGIWLFFAGSTIGVYTDKEGGWKAVLIVGLITGYLAVWASSLYFPLLPQELRQFGQTASDTDHSYILTPFLYLAKLLFGYNP